MEASIYDALYSIHQINEPHYKKEITKIRNEPQ